MSFFKKIGHAIESAFKKAPQKINNFFKKGGELARGVSKGLSTASKVMGKIGQGVGKVVNNPIAQGIATILAPELAPELIAGGKLLEKGLQTGSKLAQMGSHFTDAKSYNKGSHLENIADAVRRGQELKGEGEKAQAQFV